MANMSAPPIPDVPVPILGEDALRRLLKACDGSEFADRRDHAMIRLLIDCGLRRAELAGVQVGDVDFEHECVIVMGKGRRPRAVPFGAKTARALDRYLRDRARQPRASSTALWLGPRGPVTGSGVADLMRRWLASAADAPPLRRVRGR